LEEITRYYLKHVNKYVSKLTGFFLEWMHVKINEFLFAFSSKIASTLKFNFPEIMRQLCVMKSIVTSVEHLALLLVVKEF